MTLVLFPKTPRRQPVTLPADAYPIGRERVITIEPAPDGWVVMESDDGGSMWLGDKLTKQEAIAIGLQWVRECNCELVLTNKYEDDLPRWPG